MEKAFIALIVLLAGCSTPETVMKNTDTGQVVRCGGNTTSSMFLGAVGYYMQKSEDANCVTGYAENGFKRINDAKNPN